MPAARTAGTTTRRTGDTERYSTAIVAADAHSEPRLPDACVAARRPARHERRAAGTPSGFRRARAVVRDVDPTCVRLANRSPAAAVSQTKRVAVQRRVQHDAAAADGRRRQRERRARSAPAASPAVLPDGHASEPPPQRRRPLAPDSDGRARRGRSGRPTATARVARAAQPRRSTAIHKAATSDVVHRLHGLEQHDGIVATMTAAATPASGPASRRATTNVSHTSNAAGDRRDDEDRRRDRQARRNGASNSENPGAQTGEAASGLTGEGMNPAGANVSAASGHGRRASQAATSAAARRCANASAIKP